MAVSASPRLPVLPTARCSFSPSSPNCVPNTCFLCGVGDLPESARCPHCKLVFSCEEHFPYHRLESKSYCFPFRVDYKPGIGRILRATRNIKALEVILIDPGAVTGPNYSTRPVCLECLSPVKCDYLCPECKYPMCSPECAKGPTHAKECAILARCKKWPEPLKVRSHEEETNAYAVITPLRLLLLSRETDDESRERWRRSNQLMDHLEERLDNAEEWNWYQRYIVEFFQQELELEFSDEEINRVIGLINVNSVALQSPKRKNNGKPVNAGSNAVNMTKPGKGLYPIFAIMSHYCICNARYVINPATSEMYVRARRPIMVGEELSVQYLSALYGNRKRRSKIRSEWYFDCLCRRCSDPSECGSNISAVHCYECSEGYLLPSNSLDNDSDWRCNKCSFTLNPSAVDLLVEGIEEELNEIGKSGKFDRYEGFIDKYAGSVLHPHHYLLMTATRNLIQFYTYGAPNEILAPETLKKKLELCKTFYAVLTKVDPGYSEIRNFVQKELNFCRLLVSQHEFNIGVIGREEYLHQSRLSLNALDDVEKNKKLVQFF